MAKPGPKVGWVSTLREQVKHHKDEAKFWEDMYQHESEVCAHIHARLWGFNKQTRWQKLLFILKGGWI